MIRIVSILACIAVGGGLGALAREGTMSLLHGLIGLPVFVSLCIVNVLGSCAIGIVFGHIELAYNRREHSRLDQLPIPGRYTSGSHWPTNDPTMLVVDVFKRSAVLQAVSALVITGFLGAYTTFSAFCLLTVQLLESNNIIEAIISIVGSVALGLFAVWCGIHIGCRTATRGRLQADCD